MAYYAWSRIIASVDESGRPDKVFNPGDTVSKGDVDDFDQLVNSGVVRETPYPDMGDFDGSPNDYYRSLIDKALAPETPVNITTDRLDEREAKNLQEAGLVPAGAEPVSQAQPSAKNK